MDIPIVGGRASRDNDNNDAPLVMVVNQSLANRYFSGDPLGRQLQFSGDPKRQWTIVGVVADTRTDALSQAPAPEIYLPFWQNGAFSKHLVVRSHRSPRDSSSSCGARCTASTPRRRSSARRPWHRFAASRWPHARLRCACSSGSRSRRRRSRWSASTAYCRCRWDRDSRRSPSGRRSARSSSDILRSVLSEGGRMILIGVVVGGVVARGHGPGARDAAVRRAADGCDLDRRCRDRLRRHRAGRVSASGAARRTYRSRLSASSGVALGEYFDHSWRSAVTRWTRVARRAGIAQPARLPSPAPPPRLRSSSCRAR